mmetsp:Transcript_2112/g.3947  ORF Transcript_2112/g.3947 Transcript_2112/m.3947 type:complete len:200 (+) Transcript_2112:151-750(+)
MSCSGFMSARFCTARLAASSRSCRPPCAAEDPAAITTLSSALLLRLVSCGPKTWMAVEKRRLAPGLPLTSEDEVAVRSINSDTSVAVQLSNDAAAAPAMAPSAHSAMHGDWFEAFAKRSKRFGSTAARRGPATATLACKGGRRRSASTPRSPRAATMLTNSGSGSRGSRGGRSFDATVDNSKLFSASAVRMSAATAPSA